MLIQQYTEHMEAIEFRKALADLREIWVSGNNYIAKTEPWKAVKADKARAATILNTGLNLIHLFGVLSAPIMPTKAKKRVTKNTTKDKKSLVTTYSLFLRLFL